MKTVFVVEALRTPVGKFGGTLSHIRPDDLAAFILKKVAAKNTWLNLNELEEVILGAANQSGEDNRNVARMAALLAGFPVSVSGVTVNRLCASGLQAIADAAKNISTNNGDIYMAGGVESMSRAPYVLSKAETSFSRTQQMYDTAIGWRFTNPAFAKDITYSMGETAENVARKWNISREEQDAFALASQQKYETAFITGKFTDEIEAIEVEVERGKAVLFEKDEHPRKTTLESLAKLKPAFVKDGTVTAGNSSGINDGAAALLLASEDVVKANNLKPLARVVSSAAAGVEAAYMGIGPVPATQKALKRAGITINDIGLAELNEAFASQSLACLQELELNPNIVNVNGGAIAIGHPLGCTGARISATLLHEMQRRENVRYGLATMCIGVGQGMAVIYEKC